MKRYVWLVALISAATAFSALPTVAATQGPLLGAWETVTTTGTYTPRSRAASALANNRLWVIGGQDASGNVVNTVEGLYVLTRAWETKNPMPTARRDAAAVAVDGKVYVIGGADQEGTPLDTVEVFDPVANTWTTKQSMPTARAAMVAVAYTRKAVPPDVDKKEIHVYGSDPAAMFPADHAYEIYDIASDSWSTGPMAPSAQCEAAGCVAKDMASQINHVYLFGGYSGGAGPAASCWRLDPATETWDDTVASMPAARIQCAAITIDAASPDSGSAQYPFLIGGNATRDGGYSAQIMVYESGGYNGWVTGDTVAPDLPEPKGDRPAVCVAGGRLYVAGGANDAGPSSTVYRATINTTNYPPPPPLEEPLLVGWENVGANIPTPRWYTMNAVVDGKLYVIGGWDTSDGYSAPSVGTNEVYDPAANSWATRAPMPVPVRGGACAAIDGKIYIAGGQKTARGVPDFENTLQIYDPSTDSWVVGPPMPTPRNLVTGFALAERFHVMAGIKDDPANPGTEIPAGEHEVYDPVSDSWTTLVPPGSPWPLADSSATVVARGEYQWVYFGSGSWGPTQISLAARWNGVPGGAYNDQWYAISDLPVGGNSGATIITVTDSAAAQWPVIFGGHFGPVGYYNKVFVYHEFDDPVLTNRWVKDTALPYPRGGRMAVAQIGNYVYVAAGMGPLGLAADTWRTAIGSGLPMDVSRIGEAIAQPNGKRVSFTEPKTVTRVFQFIGEPFETHIWIEEDDRASALRVGPISDVVNPGNKVLVTGTMATDVTTGERILNPISVTVDPTVYTIPSPIGITNKSFMGAPRGPQPGRSDGVGLNNLGMLARVWGRVTNPAPIEGGFDTWPYFYIDDGSNLLDGTTSLGEPNVGLRVYHNYYVNPPFGAIVSVKGIISCEKIGGVLVPMLLSDEVTMTDDTAVHIW